MNSETTSEMLDVPTENALLVRAKAGDRSALSRLIRAHYSAMYHLALKYAHSRERAQDALQDSCVQVIRHIHNFRSESRFSSWMSQIVINSVRLGFRSDRRLVPVEIDHWNDKAVGAPTPEALTANRHYLTVVDDCLRGGRDGDYQLFFQRYVVGQSVSSISAETGVSVPAIKTRVHRARARLRARLTLSEGQIAH